MTADTPDRPDDEGQQQGGGSSDEEVREFVEEVENDPSENPDDPELERIKGG